MFKSKKIDTSTVRHSHPQPTTPPLLILERAPVLATLPERPDVLYQPGFLSEQEADELLQVLLRELSFRSETYVIEGREFQTKRKMHYMSEKPYTYSGQTFEGRPWHPALWALKERVEAASGCVFNAVLCNFYENAEAGMGWHADKEPELGAQPVIASISLGQTRRFAFRHRRDVCGQKTPPKLLEYALNSGDLLVMQGLTQRYFEHSLLTQSLSKAPGVRLNLTFRHVRSNAQ